VRVTPDTATNIVGNAHTVQVFVETTSDGGLTWTGVQGVFPVVAITPAGTTITTNACADTGTDATGMCTVTFNSTTPGTYTVTATYNLTVAGLPAPVPVTGTATKIYVDYRISITPQSATNLVSTDHVFTVLVEKDSGDGNGFQPLPGVMPSVTTTGAGGITAQTCDTPGTDASGQCTVTLSSAATGQTTVTASYTGTAGTAQAPQTKEVTAQATKTWIDYQVTVAPSATNIVGTDHVFTVTVKKDSGDGSGFQPLAGAMPTVTLTAPGTITGNTCASPGTDASGNCTVTVTSTATGTSTLTATYTGSAPGTAAAPETRDYTASATKTWIDYSISITPQSATNLVNNSHVFTVTVQKDSGDGEGFQPLAGVSPTVTTSLGTITANTCATPGTDASGQCTVTVNSDTPGIATITASFTGTAPGVGQAPETKTVTATATKNFISYTLTLSPAAAINQFPIPEERVHTITATLTGLPDNTTAPVANQTISLTLTSNVSTITASSNGTVAADGKSATCITDANGQCTITLTATSAGLAVVNGSFQASVGGATQTFTSNPARKAWVNYSVGVTPFTATNIVGFPHTITVLTQEFDGESTIPLADQHPVVAITPTGGGPAITPTDNSCQSVGTTSLGVCTVTFVTNTPGTYTVTATNNVSVTVADRTVTIPITSTATKTYVDYAIAISGDSTNPAGVPHTFTVTVTKDSGDGKGFQPLAGAVPQIALSAGFSGSMTTTCGSGTDANGQCTVTVTSNKAESVTVTANYTGTVGTETKPVSASATKTWVITNIKVTKTASPTALTIAVGQTSASLTWTITVTNTTSTPAANVMAVDTLPAGWTFNSYNGNGQFTCSVAGQVVTCNATPSTLPGNGVISFTVTATAPTASLTDQSTIVNQVKVSTSTGETTLVDNANSSSTPVIKQLPPTGADPWRALWLGSLLTLAGIGFWLAGRRKQPTA
jgi:adhesin/invasin